MRYFRVIARSLLAITIQISLGRSIPWFQPGQPSGTQSDHYAYGDSITFAVEANSLAPIEGAQISVRVMNRPEARFEVLVTNPNTHIAVSKTLTTAELGLPPFAHITYSWELQRADGETITFEPQVVLYEDNSVPWSWHVVQQGQIYVHTDGEDTTTADAAASAAVESVRYMSDLVGVHSGEDIHIYIYPQLSMLAEALRKHQRHVSDWVPAFADPDQRGIFVTSDDRSAGQEALQRDVSHEIAHLLVYDGAGQYSRSVPGWFSEGVATLGSRSEQQLDAILGGAVDNGVLLSLETLCTPEFANLPPRDKALAYAQSRSFAQYILSRYGPSQISGLLSAFRDGKSCDEAVQLVLGTSLAHIESQWHASLSPMPRNPSDLPNSLLPWLLAWGASIGITLLLVPRHVAVGNKSAYYTRHSLPPRDDGE